MYLGPSSSLGWRSSAPIVLLHHDGRHLKSFSMQDSPSGVLPYSCDVGRRRTRRGSVLFWAHEFSLFPRERMRYHARGGRCIHCHIHKLKEFIDEATDCSLGASIVLAVVLLLPAA